MRYTLQCNHCGNTIESAPLTDKQKRAIKAVLDPRADTGDKAAKLARVSRSTVSRLTQNDNTKVALVAAARKQSDKTRDLASRQQELVSRLLDEVEETRDPIMLGNTVKLLSDLRVAEQRLGIADSSDTPAQQRERLEKFITPIIILVSRYARRYGVAPAVDAVVERAERQMMRR